MTRLLPRRQRALVILLLVGGAAIGCTKEAPQRAAITIAAASSLTGVMEDVTALWGERSPVQVRCTFSATSTLVRQIERGAPCDVLLSANRFWVRHLESMGLVDEADTFPLALNQLAAVASPREGASTPSPGELSAGRWALGDPEHVPAGVYAKAALQESGRWSEIEDRVVPAPSARAALRLVERGEVEFGIVYETDLLGSDRAVRVPGVFSSVTSVELVGSPLRSAGSQAREFCQWLQSAEVAAVFRRYGFEMPGAR